MKRKKQESKKTNKTQHNKQRLKQKPLLNQRISTEWSLNTVSSPKDLSQRDTETGKSKENVSISDRFTVLGMIVFA
jgi:hypothetical protein